MLDDGSIRPVALPPWSTKDIDGLAQALLSARQLVNRVQGMSTDSPLLLGIQGIVRNADLSWIDGPRWGFRKPDPHSTSTDAVHLEIGRWIDRNSRKQIFLLYSFVDQRFIEGRLTETLNKIDTDYDLSENDLRMVNTLAV